MQAKDDEHKVDNFPALKWALDYADYVAEQKDIIISKELKEGWYLPSYNEWMQAFINRIQTTAAFSAAGAPFDILQDSFWTSTSIMGKTDGKVGWYIYLTPKVLKYPDKENTALAMREFK